MDVQSSSGNTYLSNVEIDCGMLKRVKEKEEKDDKKRVI
jgi:hypothetical protein